MIEIEYKYKAEKIKRIDLRKQIPTPIATYETQGEDVFYANPLKPKAFIRHRVSQRTNQLTFKQKLKNNTKRIEFNIDLSLDKSEDLKYFLRTLGYEKTNSIWKSAVTYEYYDHYICYYTIYTIDMVYLGAFFEIEVKEGVDSPIKLLNQLERAYLNRLCLTKKDKEVRSLYEMFGRRNKTRSRKA